LKLAREKMALGGMPLGLANLEMTRIMAAQYYQSIIWY
jgi:hypothetical protein